MEYCAGKLSFYQEGQLQGSMKIDYLTKICLDRMKLLTQIDNWNNENSSKENEQLQNFGNIDVNLSQLEENILLEAKRCNLAIETSQNQQSFNNNLVSHYFCKIAFSIFKPQKLDWFMDQEIILFRARVKKASQYDQKVVLKLLESEGLQIEHINNKNLTIEKNSEMETEYAEDFQSDDEKELIEMPKKSEKKGYQIPFYFGLECLVKQYKINVIGQVAQVPEEYI